MKTFLDCIPCFFGQALFTARALNQDDEVIKKILDRLGSALKDIPMDCPPPETGRTVYQIVREVTGIEDPYHHLKAESIEKALKLYPSLKTMVQESEDTIDTAVRLAIAGNVIDFGVNRSFKIEEEIHRVLRERPAPFHIDLFRRKLERAENILYLGDNAGETVFDRILIETMGLPVTYAVRERPIINDAILEDALKSGLGDVATLVSSGCDTPGTILNRCSKVFLERLEKAELIISKGQGNFEGLFGTKLPAFFLLKVKCRTVAEHIGLKEGSLVLMTNAPENTSMGDGYP
ncbi:MAG: ARMT1-like domain-containing protein [Pseudomonadota bacterium]